MSRRSWCSTWSRPRRSRRPRPRTRRSPSSSRRSARKTRRPTESRSLLRGFGFAWLRPHPDHGSGPESVPSLGSEPWLFPESRSLKCVVGLGNPGRKYAGSRHNIGFDVVEAFARKHGFGEERKKFKALYQERVLSLGSFEDKVYLLRPQTYMNLSGDAVRDFVGYFGADTRSDLSETLLVVFDDLDLPEGRLRFRGKGSAGGHRGVQSIISQLGHGQFSRLKVGIGRDGRRDAADYVLAKVDAGSRAALDRATAEAVDALEAWLERGLERAAERFNGVSTEAPEAGGEARRPRDPDDS